MERSSLYDQYMLDNARRIKDQAIEMQTLENLLHVKTKEMSEHVIFHYLLALFRIYRRR